MGTLHHACTRLSPRMNRYVADYACSTATCELASIACHSEPSLYRLHPPATSHRCLQSIETYQHNLLNRVYKFTRASTMYSGILSTVKLHAYYKSLIVALLSILDISKPAATCNFCQFLHWKTGIQFPSGIISVTI